METLVQAYLLRLHSSLDSIFKMVDINSGVAQMHRPKECVESFVGRDLNLFPKKQKNQQKHHVFSVVNTTHAARPNMLHSINTTIKRVFCVFLLAIFIFLHLILTVFWAAVCPKLIISFAFKQVQMHKSVWAHSYPSRMPVYCWMPYTWRPMF